MAINKVYASFDEAVADIHDGATIMVGGFAGPGGLPENLIAALHKQGAKNLTIIANAFWGGGHSSQRYGRNYIDLCLLAENKQVKKAIVSLINDPRPGRSRAFEEQYRAGEVEMELVPQGTLAERIRAGGAGIGGFYTRTGVGTIVEQGKEKKIINGEEYILELPLRADYAFVKAYKADKMGNLIYWGTARNFNPVMATAAEVTIAEVDEIVEVGEIDPNIIVTPGIFVKRIVEVGSRSH